MLPSHTVDTALLGLLLAVVAVTSVVMLRRSPRVGFCVWLGSLCLVPIWIGIGVGPIFVPLVAAVAFVVLVMLLPIDRFRLSPADGLLAILVVVNVVSLASGQSGVALTALATTLVYFATGYGLGRVAGARLDVHWIYAAIGVALTVVAILAIVEFAMGRGIYTGLRVGNSLYTAWGGDQFRGGVMRAEAGFGHSIALGSSLAIGLPLTLASRLPIVARVTMIVVLLGGIVCSLSRVGMIAGALGLVLTVVFLKGTLSRRVRVAFLIIIGLATIAVFPPISRVFEAAGDEAIGSSNYRGDLLSLVPEMAPIGVSASASRSSTGELYFGGFQSIDSQIILTGLTAGLLPLLLVLVALAVAVLTVLSRRATPATIALVAQIPVIATTALITQWSVFFWFLAGLAVTTQLTRARESALLIPSLVPRSLPRPSPQRLSS